MKATKMRYFNKILQKLPSNPLDSAQLGLQCVFAILSLLYIVSSVIPLPTKNGSVCRCFVRLGLLNWRQEYSDRYRIGSRT